MNTDVRGAGVADAWDDAVQDREERERVARERARREDGLEGEAGADGEVGADGETLADGEAVADREAVSEPMGASDAELAEYEGDDAVTHERAGYYADAAHAASYGGDEGEELRESELESELRESEGLRESDLGEPELREPEDAELSTYADDGGRVAGVGGDELGVADADVDAEADADAEAADEAYRADRAGYDDRADHDELDDDIAAAAAIGRNADPDFEPRADAGAGASDVEYAVAEPVLIEPDVAESSLTEPSVTEPSMAEPVVTEPGLADSVEEQRDLPGAPATDGAPLIAAAQEHDFLERWSRAQIGFVEDPRQAVSDAEALFEDIMAAQREALEARRSDLTGQSHDNGADTEDLRLAMRGYGQLVSMLLAHAA